MKKIQSLALGAVVALGSLASCSGGVSNASLKTDVDTISYALGTQLAEGLPDYLNQLGVTQDTAMIASSYVARIAAETELDKKVALEKEMKAKIDSVSKVNVKNLAEFIKGLNVVLAEKDLKSPYAQGLGVGNQIAQQMVPNMERQIFGESGDKKVNGAALLKGLQNALKKEALAVPNAAELIQSISERSQKEAMAKQEAELQAQHADKLAAANKFLAENKAKEGVVTLPSGLQYKILKEGTGAKPTAADRVTVHYHGTLIDGTVFDSSVDRKEPASFGVGQVIKGWTEGLQLMPVGSKWIFYIPYDLAYGPSGNQGIPPFSTLVFEVELLSIDK